MSFKRRNNKEEENTNLKHDRLLTCVHTRNFAVKINKDSAVYSNIMTLWNGWGKTFFQIKNISMIILFAVYVYYSFEDNSYTLNKWIVTCNVWFHWLFCIAWLVHVMFTTSLILNIDYEMVVSDKNLFNLQFFF